MSKYQDPNFNKEDYWKGRNTPGTGKLHRMLDRAALIVAAHYGPDWPKKAVSKKALLKNTKRARKAQEVQHG